MNRGAAALRFGAIAIAILAVLDPVITTNRAAPPEISVVAVDASHDSVLAARVARQLDGAFQVIAAPLPSADATVLVGDRLPDRANDLATPVFLVSPGGDGPSVAIESLRAPAQASLDSKVTVLAQIRAANAGGRTLHVTLRLGGVVVDRAERPIASNDTVVPLTLTPATVGAASLRVTAAINGAAGDRARDADLVVDVRETKWSVYFFDPRPSWQSTFVRRAIESDARFAVTSRVTTSKNISTDAGTPPSLDDVGGISHFDAVIVGAPDALNDREVTGLEGYLRRRGGSAVLLLDQRGDGPFQRLVGTNAWRDNGNGRVTAITGGLRASSLAWPAHLPDGAEALARSAPVQGDTTPAAPVIWQLPVGAGHLVVSGVLDAWRYRDSSVSAFDGYWRTLIADAANASAPALALRVPNRPLLPGEVATVAITLRDAALQPLPAHAAVGAMLQSADGSLQVPIRLWPTGGVGELVGSVRAPAVPGPYRIVVTSDRNRADGFIVVSRTVARTAPDDRELIAAWARSRGGKVITANGLGSLPAALRSAIHPAAQPTRWHPMHSLWWLLPFALALSFEWWWRRRRGLR